MPGPASRSGSKRRLTDRRVYERGGLALTVPRGMVMAGVRPAGHEISHPTARLKNRRYPVASMFVLFSW